MRIIAGRFKGHPLVAFKASHIRPTTDRVKETIFNKLMGELPDARVWDLYAGTGNLGLEALSRGAGHVTFVESHKKSLQILQQNISKLKVESEVSVRKSDVFQFLKARTGCLTRYHFCGSAIHQRAGSLIDAGPAGVWSERL